MDELVAFLLARLAEDEQVAREPLDDDPDPSLSILPRDNAAHDLVVIPARRALAEVAAKRAIIDRIVPGIDHLHSYIEISHADDPQIEAVDLLKILALPYAAHPDYREEWKP